MSFRDAGYREYNKMSENGLRKMTNSEIKQYQDKKVKIYIYNNMNYVDILN